MKNFNPSKQAGYTLSELLIVVVVLAILASLGITGYKSWVSGTNVDAQTYFVERDLPAAISQCYRINRSYTPCTYTELTTKYGVKAKTQWETAWTLSNSGTNFTLNIPVSDSDTATKLADRLSKSESPVITGASYSAPNVTVSMSMP